MRSIYVVFKMVDIYLFLNDNCPESLKPLLSSIGVVIWTKHLGLYILMLCDELIGEGALLREELIAFNA